MLFKVVMRSVKTWPHIMSVETKSHERRGLISWRSATCQCFTVRYNEDTSIFLQTPKDVITVILSSLRHLAQFAAQADSLPCSITYVT
jgi:hypothetical protein